MFVTTVMILVEKNEIQVETCSASQQSLEMAKQRRDKQERNVELLH